MFHVRCSLFNAFSTTSLDPLRPLVSKWQYCQHMRDDSMASMRPASSFFGQLHAEDVSHQLFHNSRTSVITLIAHKSAAWTWNELQRSIISNHRSLSAVWGSRECPIAAKDASMALIVACLWKLGFRPKPGHPSQRLPHQWSCIRIVPPGLSN